MSTQRVLITGISGFAGGHLAELCHGEGAEITGISRRPDTLDRIDPETSSATDLIQANLLDPQEAMRAFDHARPDWVFHLAGLASVGRSREDPARTIQENLLTTLNVLEAVRALIPRARVLVVSSGEIYGPQPTERLPITEDAPLRPQNPYATSKAALDLLAGQYADSYDLDIIRARSFNHAGPRQSDTYVTASFARQIAEGERAHAAGGPGKIEMRTGSLKTRRDFTDVRDVVRAYWLAAESARRGAYNVCSGRSVATGDLLTGLAQNTDLSIEQTTDPGRVRKGEVADLYGSNEKIATATGWKPEIPLERTLKDTLDWWRKSLVAEVSG